MTWPFLYFPGERLSAAELAGARLDGDLVEVGEAFMPADAVETRELRAASLRRHVPPTMALIRESAAWVHGAVSEPPGRHLVQRVSASRVHVPHDPRTIYRDQRIDPEAVVRIGGVWVTTPARTLADLVRAAHGGDPVRGHVEALLIWRPHLAAEALGVLESGRSLHHKRPAIAFLRSLVEGGRMPQDDVTRYTS